jgi:hypothetical protein
MHPIHSHYVAVVRNDDLHRAAERARRAGSARSVRPSFRHRIGDRLVQIGTGVIGVGERFRRRDFAGRASVARVVRGPDLGARC